MIINELLLTTMKATLQQALNRRSLEEDVSFLELSRDHLLNEKKRIEKKVQCLEVCITFLGGILNTHSCKDIPDYNSGKSLFFFRNQEGRSVLIEELKPSPDLMPEMERIPLAQAQTQDMKVGGRGYVIQRVLLAYPMGYHRLMLICFERNIFEEL